MTYYKKKKHYGQHFLTNPAIPRRIVKESGITADCGVIEIGPGFGILTTELTKAAKKVIAVEIDSDIIPILEEKIAGIQNLKIINSDIMKLDISELIETELSNIPVCVCANLPYYITTPILMKLLEGKYGFESITVMVQKEYADRLCSKSGSKNYGAITAVVNYYANTKRLFIVSAGSFSPPPKVNSAVIRLDIYKTPPVKIENEKLFFNVIKAAFSQRRKTLVNSLYSMFSSFITKDEICNMLNKLELPTSIRGENLGIEEFANITNWLYKSNMSKSQSD